MPLPAKVLPSQQELESLFDYVPQSGALLWRPREEKTKADVVFNKTLAGKSAGYQTTHGYIAIEFGGSSYKAHRIIWKIVTGLEPEWVDHIDRNRANNKWTNLRDATLSQNGYNTTKSPRNTSGFRCVSYIQRFKKFRAAVQVNGKKKHIGYFDNAEDAALAAQKVIVATRGEFANVE